MRRSVALRRIKLRHPLIAEVHPAMAARNARIRLDRFGQGPKVAAGCSDLESIPGGRVHETLVVAP
jgi:hypothetical protein